MSNVFRRKPKKRLLFGSQNAGQLNRVFGNKGGKGGGGGGRAAVEDPNTLQSRAIARILDLVSEGEIVGLVNGFRSIKFNGTPVENPDGSRNFEGIVYDFRPGTPTQDYMPGFPAAESEVLVGVEVRANLPITRTVSNTNVDAVVVTVRIPALTFQSKETGDLHGSSVQIAFDVQAQGGSYVTHINDTIVGKTTSPYERSYRISLQGTGPGPWNIRMRRVSPDSNEVNLQNQTVWSRYTEIVDHKVEYMDSAYFGLTVDSQLFNDVPTRSYHVRGLITQVPSNYDPATRTYSGIWNGTFKRAYHNNPVWVLYDLLTNRRYGLGRYIKEENIDKASFYAASVYSDELVPDGRGGVEPRFTFNGVIAARESAYSVLQTIASTFRAMIYWSAGTVMIAQDRPADPVKLVVPGNVIDGEFNYSGTGLKTRHTVALVTWNDPEDGFRQGIEVVEDPDGIDRYGWNSIDVTAYGCTSRGQAHRTGKWLLDTEQNCTETVSYRCSFDHFDVMPGDIIQIADPNYAGIRMGGRIVSATANSITIDAPVDVTVGDVHTLYVTMPDGSIETRQLNTGGGTHTVLSFIPALPAVPEPFAVWMLASSDVAPRQFRVIAVREADKHIYEVTALLHDPFKYDRVEFGLNFVPNNFAAVPTGPPLPPDSLNADAYLFTNGVSISTAINLSWSPPRDARVYEYEVQAKGPEDVTYVHVETTRLTTMDFYNVADGLWNFRVRSRSIDGFYGPYVHLNNFDNRGIEDPPANVTDFRLSVANGQVFLQWTPIADLDASYYKIRHSPLPNNASWEGSIDISPPIPHPTSFATVQALEGTYLIKAVDASGIESAAATTVRAKVGTLIPYNIIVSLVQHPTFPGVKNNCQAA